MIYVHSIPVYWGIERDAPDRSFLTRATLDEILPPYRVSNRAIRIRVSHRHWLHIGLCRYKNEVTPWGLEVLPEHIGGWKSAPPEDDTEAEPSGSAAGGGSDPGAGDGAPPLLRVVPGAESPGDRQGVDPERDAPPGDVG